VLRSGPGRPAEKLPIRDVTWNSTAVTRGRKKAYGMAADLVYRAVLHNQFWAGMCRTDHNQLPTCTGGWISSLYSKDISDKLCKNCSMPMGIGSTMEENGAATGGFGALDERPSALAFG
jgi:hypothetical protein